MSADPNIGVADVPFPAGIFDLDFDVLGESECIYSGTADAPDLFTCPNIPCWVQCVDNSQDGQLLDCDGEFGVDSTYPKVTCYWN
jgi:hypothetical protein